MCNINDIIKARVTNIKEYGAFVRLKDKKVGMIHISEVSDNFVQTIDDFFSVGDEIDVMVLGVEDDKFKLSYKAVKTNNTGIEPGFGSLRRNLSKWIEEEKNEK